MSGISRFGRKLLLAYGVLLLLDVVALAFAARVNIYQEFYFMADLFPFGLSIATLAVLLFLIAFLTVMPFSFISRPAFQIGMLVVTSVFWLAFNAFSTSRWQGIPMPCSSIPEDYPEERTWCTDVQALKFIIWVEFFGLLVTTMSLAHSTLAQQRHGNRHVWRVPIAKFDPRADAQRAAAATSYHARTTSVATFGSFGPSASFAPPSVVSAYNERPASENVAGFGSGLQVRPATYEAATPGYGTMTAGLNSSTGMLGAATPSYATATPNYTTATLNYTSATPGYGYTPGFQGGGTLSPGYAGVPTYGTVGSTSPVAPGMQSAIDWFAPNSFAPPTPQPVRKSANAAGAS